MSEWRKELSAADQKTREALELAHKALTEIAQTRGLSPDGERARDLCADALQKLGRGERRARGF